MIGDHRPDRVLYNQTAQRLRSALAGCKHTVIADVPSRQRAEPAVAGRDAPDAGPGNDIGVAPSA